MINTKHLLQVYVVNGTFTICMLGVHFISCCLPLNAEQTQAWNISKQLLTPWRQTGTDPELAILEWWGPSDSQLFAI